MSLLPGQSSKSKTVPPLQFIGGRSLASTNREQIRESPRTYGRNCPLNTARKGSSVPKAGKELKFGFYSQLSYRLPPPSQTKTFRSKSRYASVGREPRSSFPPPVYGDKNGAR